MQKIVGIIPSTLGFDKKSPLNYLDKKVFKIE